MPLTPQGRYALKSVPAPPSAYSQPSSQSVSQLVTRLISQSLPQSDSARMSQSGSHPLPQPESSSPSCMDVLTSALARPFICATALQANRVEESPIDDILGPFAPERYMSLPPGSRAAGRALITVALAKGLSEARTLETVRRDTMLSSKSDDFGKQSGHREALENNSWFEEISATILGKPLSFQSEIETSPVTRLSPPNVLPSAFTELPLLSYDSSDEFSDDQSETPLPHSASGSKCLENSTESPYSSSFSKARHDTNIEIGMIDDDNLTAPLVAASEMEVPLSSDVLNAGHKVSRRGEHLPKNLHEPFLANEGSIYTSSVNSKSRLTLDVVLVFDDESNKVSIDWHEKVAEEHPPLHASGPLSHSRSVPPFVSGSVGVGRTEPLSMEKHCNIRENAPKTLLEILLAGNDQDCRGAAVSDEPEVKTVPKNLTNTLDDQVDKPDVIILDEDDDDPPRPLKKRRSKIPASHKTPPIVSIEKRRAELRRKVESRSDFEIGVNVSPSTPSPFSQKLRSQNSVRTAKRILRRSSSPELGLDSGARSKRSRQRASYGQTASGNNSSSDRVENCNRRKADISRGEPRTSSPRDDPTEEVEGTLIIKPERSSSHTSPRASRTKHGMTGVQTRSNTRSQKGLISKSLVELESSESDDELAVDEEIIETGSDKASNAQVTKPDANFVGEAEKASGPGSLVGDKCHESKLSEGTKVRQKVRTVGMLNLVPNFGKTGSTSNASAESKKVEILQGDEIRMKNNEESGKDAEGTSNVTQNILRGLDELRLKIGRENAAGGADDLMWRDEVLKADRLAHGEDSDSSDLLELSNVGSVLDDEEILPIVRGLLRPCKEDGLSLDEIQDGLDVDSETTHYHRLMRNAPEYTPDVVSFGTQFAKHIFSNRSFAWNMKRFGVDSDNAQPAPNTSSQSPSLDEDKSRRAPEVLPESNGAHIPDSVGAVPESPGIGAVQTKVASTGNNPVGPNRRVTRSQKAHLAKPILISNSSGESEEDEEVEKSSESDTLEEQLVSRLRSKRSRIQAKTRIQRAKDLQNRVCGDFQQSMTTEGKKLVLRWASRDFSWFDSGKDSAEIMVQTGHAECPKCDNDPMVPSGSCESTLLIRLNKDMSWRKVRRLRHRHRAL